MTTAFTSDIQVIIPAAGSSSRLGYPKQTIERDGTLLWQSIVGLTENNDNLSVTLVTGSWYPTLRSLSGQRLNIVHHPDWSDGMGSSIACGVKYSPVPKRGYLVLLVDQWGLTEASLNRFISQWSGAAIQVASDDDYRGPPALFPVTYREKLLSLSGDQGARNLIKAEPAVYTELPGAGLDLDTDEDRLRMQQARFQPYNNRELQI